MSDRYDLAEQAALSLIAADAEFFRDFVFSPHLESIRPIASLALMPFLSAFVCESAKYFERKDSSVGRGLEPHEEMLRTSRMRVKLTEDKYKSSAEVLNDAYELVAINSSWFLKGHRGFLGALKRLLQPDLGIFFINNEIICTTHVAFLNMGLTKEALSDSSLSLNNLGPHLRDRMFDVGEYVGALLNQLNINTQASKRELEDPLPPIQYRDMKSKGLYEAMAHQVAPGQTRISVLMTQMLSQTNTARVVVPRIAGENEVAALKIGFVSLFQTVSSLRKLLEEEQNSSFLQPGAVEQIRTMLEAAPVRSVHENRGLRNNLVHYGVSKRVSSHLSADLPLCGLIEAHMSGKTFAEVANDVKVGLDCVSKGLQDMLPQTLTPEATL